MTVRVATPRNAFLRFVAHERVNFLLTNRIPRRLASDFIGWFSKIEQPLVARVGLALWQWFCDVDLSDAETTRFASLHAGFTRRLRDGARPQDLREDVLTSPCDAIVGAQGTIDGDIVQQIKGAPYSLCDLLGGSADIAHFNGGHYLTLRLTAGMYHRFHAPHDLTIDQVTYIAGDCWNVNPIALARIERLFCKNERAVIHCRLANGSPVILVAVAAVLVSSIRFSFLEPQTPVRNGGPRTIPIGVAVAKGDELGWFEHGSTIVMLVPPGYRSDVHCGQRPRAGQSIVRTIKHD